MKFILLALTLFAVPAFGACYQEQVMTLATAGADHKTTDQTDATTFGAAIDLSSCTVASVQATWAGLTGSINGILSVWVSTDSSCTTYIQKSDASGNPVQITLSGANSSNSISLNGGVVSEKCYQLRYAHTGVTGGTISAWVGGK